MAEAENLQSNGHTDHHNGSTQISHDTIQNSNNDKLDEHPKGKFGVGKEKLSAKKEKIKEKAGPPAGGYDSTAIPAASSGYTVKFTIHKATNMPIADLNTRSADPFVRATLTSELPTRHKEDPDMVFRTFTAHKNVNPEWNSEWIVAGVPSSGFRLKCRIYDEDTADHDDRLGNVTITVNNIGLNWAGIKEESFPVKKRMGSKRAYFIRGCASLLSSKVHMNGHLFLSAEILGESEKPHGRMYTVGQTTWFKHFSPMIGRIAGTKAPENDDGGDGARKTERYDFQANEFQLQGPVPAELYHRFVEFKPFVKGMFTKVGVRGFVLNKALHHQHSKVYNFSNSTLHGAVEPKSEEAALQFLKMAHFDEGGRIFTYVLTLDGLLRFTETGKEFGIDMLSKHTMHSDVAIYISCSGEFFIRRLAHPSKPTDAPEQQTHPNADLPGGPPNSPPPLDPRNYELVIDNDSGTYRPKGDLLPKLKQFLNENFPGLHVVVKECTDPELDKMKEQQKQRKKVEGANVEMVQNSDDEISSSDEEAVARGTSKRTRKQKALDALEDPSQAFKDLVPGEKGRKDREERETEGDQAGEPSGL